jgi:hypothetical protein
MARTSAGLAQGSRIAGHVSLGILAKTFPLGRVNAALATQGGLSSPIIFRSLSEQHSA